MDALKVVYDSEISVSIFGLGTIYKMDAQDDYMADMDMTFTAPNCPTTGFILEDVRNKVGNPEGIKACSVNLVLEPTWDQSMMSGEVRVESGFD